MERERRRREKSFLFFFFLYFLPFFRVCVSFLLFSRRPSAEWLVLTWKNPANIQPNIASSSSMLSKLYFIFSSSSCFVVFLTGGDMDQEKKRRRRGNIGPLKKRGKVVSSPQEKIWKYFRINLFTLNKKPERGRRFTRYGNCICTAKNTSSAAMLLPLSSRKKPCRIPTTHRPIDWCVLVVGKCRL